MKIKYLELKEREDFFIKEIEKPIFCLSNNNHWFLYSLDEKSNYFGYWVKIEDDVYKFIEDFEIKEEIKEVEIVDEKKINFIVKNNKISIYLDSQGLNLESIEPIFLKIFIDPRKLYSIKGFDKINILPKENSFFFSFYDGEKEISFNISYEGSLRFLNRRIKRSYDFDKNRNSKNFEFDVLEAFEGVVNKIKIFSLDKKTPLEIFESLQNQYNDLKNFILKRIFSLYDNGFLGGLLWFPQRWFRDELLSLYFLNIGEIKDKIINDYLENLDDWWDKNKKGGEISADTLLLLGNILNYEDLEKNREKILDILNRWEGKFMKNNEINLPSKSTWMDTLDRKRAIEIDILYLNLLKILNLEEKFKRYKTLLKTEILSNIYPEKEVYSPNIFLGYAFFKDLFNEIEWESFFDKVIEKHYLKWGGFSTIDINDPNFKNKHTGEDPSSYHSGDSWFWLNNLGAWCLKDLNYKKYEEIFKKILDASIRNLLSIGVPGFISELSSAENLTYEGCLVQLWSLSSILKIL
ncbi:MAG: amylo-alpha-1,6-glucosidase [Minisyncoccia bacterium]